MQQEIFSDGIGEISISGSIVRVDLVSLSATERDANNAPKQVFRQRIIFSVEGFANSAEVMRKALEGLIEAGAVQRTPRDGKSDSTQDSPMVLPPLAARKGSPNFN